MSRCDRVILGVHLRAWILIFFVLFTISPLSKALSAGSTPIEAGLVQATDGPRDAFKIVRKGKDLRVGKFAPLYEGDRIEVTEPEASLYVSLRDKSDIRIAQAQSPYTIPRPPKSLGWPSKLLGWVRTKLTFAEKQRVIQTVAATTRNKSGIRSPLLETNKTFLIAKARPFYLGWQGGAAPYGLEIRHFPSDTVIFAREGLDVPQIVEPDWRLRPGTYNLEITHSLGDDRNRAIFGFEVLPLDRLPASHESLSQSGLSQNAQIVLHSAWLARHDDGAWMLESHQRLAAIAEIFEPARLLDKALIHGNWLEVNQ